MAPLMIGATVGITVMLLLLDNVALWAEKELALLALGLMERGLAESRLTCRCPSYDELRISPGDEGVPAVSNRPKVDERRERGLPLRRRDSARTTFISKWQAIAVHGRG